jgi:hypothetical protein
MGSIHDASNLWVIWPTFVNKYQLVCMVNVKIKTMKCGEKPNYGKKKLFSFAFGLPKSQEIVLPT